MASYITLTTTRTTPLDTVAMLAALKTAVGDATAVLVPVGPNTWRGKKNAAWSAGDTTAAQNLLDTAAALTPQLAAQREIDVLDIKLQAVVLALIDQLNVIRAALPAPLGAITPAQALAAIRAKAGTL